MEKTVARNEIFSEIIKVYNTELKAATYDLLRSKYGLKQPYLAITRITKSDRYSYDPETDQFTCLQRDA